jgi:hypothetical protein
MPHPVTLTKEIAKMKKLYAKGLCDREVAEIMGITPYAARHRRVRHGLQGCRQGAPYGDRNGRRTKGAQSR